MLTEMKIIDIRIIAIIVSKLQQHQAYFFLAIFNQNFTYLQVDSTHTINTFSITEINKVFRCDVPFQVEFQTASHLLSSYSLLRHQQLSVACLKLLIIIFYFVAFIY
jgi:hypothetical protein